MGLTILCEIFHGILSVPPNTGMDLNNVMENVHCGMIHLVQQFRYLKTPSQEPLTNNILKAWEREHNI